MFFFFVPQCWYCNKMLYNNVAAMMHIQGHIDSERQVNLDLSDLTQCKHCYKTFDTPFEMQTHIEKVGCHYLTIHSWAFALWLTD